MAINFPSTPTLNQTYTYNGITWKWNGSAWDNTGIAYNTSATYIYVATAGQTTFSGADSNSLTLAYTVGIEQVYLNGVLLVRGVDYTATNGTSIVLTSGAIANDILEVISFSPFQVADTYTQAQANATFPLNTSAFFAGKNKLINADFAINQRNVTSTTTVNVFTADRWKTIGFSGTATWSISSIANGSFTNQVTNKAMRITSSSSSNDLGFQQAIEDVQTFAGQTVTVSFWARTSGTSYALDLVEMLQAFGTGGSTAVYTYFNTSGTTLTSTWTRYSLTTTLPSIAGKTIGTGSFLNLRIDPTTTLANGDWIEFTQIQLEAGSVATAFQTATGTIQGELAACQRYYYRTPITAGSSNYANGGCYISTLFYYQFNLPVSMRIIPTSVDYSNLQCWDITSNIAITSMTIVASNSQTNLVCFEVGTAGSGVTYRPYVLRGNGSTNYIGVSAEL